jgi:hypothetical protein
MDKRYAVVSCHVEKALDDRVWAAFARFQASRPSGFRIAALLRPPDQDAGEDPSRWLERAGEAARYGPLGHHTHWGGPEQARPLGGEPAALVQRQGAWLRENGLEPVVFCGGGWYLDEEIAAAVSDLGYADCTATAFRPRYLPEGAPRLELDRPSRLELSGGGRLLELPTTHSLGLLARDVVRPGGLREPLLHAYFHDFDLLDRRRAAVLRASLAVLARRRRVADLATVITEARGTELPVSRVSGR